ncbi:FHA domain-containing protein [Lachnospiraceae bacterium RM5]|nr:FHA domain-containing protein [Lachnospiraceae bacterium RM5]
MDFSKKEANGRSFIEYATNQGDEIDKISLGVLLYNNNIEGILPLSVGEGSKALMYDVTGKISLDEYYGDCVKKEQLLGSFYSIAKTLKAANEYMLSTEYMVLEQENIYVNKETNETGLIVLPVKGLLNDDESWNFFKTVLFMAALDPNDDNEYVGKLMTILNPRVYSLDKFIEEIESLLGVKSDDSKKELTWDKDVASIKEITKSKMDECKKELEEARQKEANIDSEIEKELEGIKADLQAFIDKAKAEEASFNDQAETASEAVAETANEASEAVTETTEEVKEEIKEEAEKAAETVSEEKEAVAESAEEVKEEIKEEVAETVETATEEVKENKNVLVGVIVSQAEEIDVDKDKFVIGSSADADFVIDEAGVEPEHAVIVRKEKEFFITPADTKIGTFMNGVQLMEEEEEFLPFGVKLRIGNTDFEFKQK